MNISLITLFSIGIICATFWSIPGEASDHCYDSAYRIGRCGAMVLHGMDCNPPELERSRVPDECINLPETLRGAKQGIKDVFEAVRILKGN
jgi:hypothetical protein